MKRDGTIIVNGQKIEAPAHLIAEVHQMLASYPRIEEKPKAVIAPTEAPPEVDQPKKKKKKDK